jgi:hypothetical protein
MWKWLSAAIVVVVSVALLNNAALWPRASIPAHMLGHAAVYKPEFITEATRAALMDLVKSFQTIPTNADDLKFYQTLHEHIGEAVPFDGRSCDHPLLVPNRNRTLCTFAGRADIGAHYIRTGGYEGLKETYETLVSRLLSFGVYLFDLEKYPVLRALFESDNFASGSRTVCPPDRQHLDPFQFNFIINTPGQTVAHHIDGVYFEGATRFSIPQWLLAVMKFSGLFEDRFVPQVQTVAYLHNWTVTHGRAGKFVFYDSADGAARVMDPTPRSANVVDGSKVIHAATVYMPDARVALLSPVAKNELLYLGDDTWVVQSNGVERARLKTDDLRVSIVYRARCFADVAAAAKFREVTSYT